MSGCLDYSKPILSLRSCDKINLPKTVAHPLSRLRLSSLRRSPSPIHLPFFPAMPVPPTPFSSSPTAVAPPPKPDSLPLSLLAGSCAGAFQVFVGNPLDVVKTRAQTAPPGRFTGPMDVAIQTYQKEGLRAFYKGGLSSVYKCRCPLDMLLDS
jgi:hypothetical protein